MRDCAANSAKFEQADLRGCKLSGSVLGSATFKNANLAKADMRYCALSSADFSGANLCGTDLRDAVLNESCKFDNETTYDQFTKFPAGFDPAAKGLKKIDSTKAQRTPAAKSSNLY
jgi:hypothetical protein